MLLFARCAVYDVPTLNPARCRQQLRHPNTSNTEVTVNAKANNGVHRVQYGLSAISSL